MRQLDTDEWVGRSIGAATAAAMLAAGLGAILYTTLPGARAIEWWLMVPALFGFSCACGLFGGPALATAFRLALQTGGGARRVGMARLIGYGAIGGVIGCAVPVALGLWSGVSAVVPEVSTGNIAFSILVGGTAFVALWATSLWQPLRPRLGAGEHVGVAAVASAIAFASSAIVVATALTSSGWLPALDGLAQALGALGFFPLVAGTTVVIGAWIGAVSGLAAWLYLSAVMVMERRL